MRKLEHQKKKFEEDNLQEKKPAAKSKFIQKVLEDEKREKEGKLKEQADKKETLARRNQYGNSHFITSRLNCERNLRPKSRPPKIIG